MRMLFTIHAGEYLVATEIEKLFKKEVNIWLPGKDIGIDLLLTNKTNKKTVSIQVKYSKDFSSTYKQIPKAKAMGWWALSREKIKNSPAEYWVFILYNTVRNANHFVVIDPKTLLTIFDKLGRKGKTIHTYITLTNNNNAFETRNLSSKDKREFTDVIYKHKPCDLTKYLNNWISIKNQLNH